MNPIRAAFRHPLLLAAVLLIFAGIGKSPAQAPKSPGSQAPPAREGTDVARFDSKEIKVEAAPGAAVVDLSYEFTNTGEIPLVVEDFSHACGCMQAASDLVPVQPGARGKITAKFLTNGLRGTVRKSVRVKFVEAGAIDLIGEVRIPELLVYSAQTLRWVVGEAPRPQQVDIVINQISPLRVLSVSANDPAFACELQTLEEARSYRIIITPRDTSTARVCVLQVRTDSKDPRDALHGLFALVEESKTEGIRP